MAIFDRIEQLLKSCNMNISQLSAASGIPATTIYSLRSRGSSKTKLSVLTSIADALGVGVAYFFDDTAAIKLSVAESELILKLRAFDAHGIKILNLIVECELERLRISRQQKR